MTAEDLYAFRFLADAQLSPDGERVAFVVRTVAPERDGYRSAIWLVPFDGSKEATRFTSGSGQDAQPRWSPDGRTLAFLSDRGVPAEKADGKGKKGKPKNVFVLSLDGGEARQLTTFEDDCGDIVWSPDGRRLAFTLKDAKAADAEDDGPRVYERMRYKTDEGFLSDQRRKHIWLVDVAGGEPRRLTDGDWDDQQLAWSPDGREIAFISNRSTDRESNTVADIHVIAVTGGATRRVTNEVGQYGNPSWSPDGKTIACYGVEKALGSASKNVHLWLWPAAGGGKGTDLLAKWDRTVGSVVMSDMRAQVSTLAPKWNATAPASSSSAPTRAPPMCTAFPWAAVRWWRRRSARIRSSASRWRTMQSASHASSHTPHAPATSPSASSAMGFAV
jgi:dipeptidyl aminopeptidase/acylaminoacyl peptidase